jgi:hypothetical protein
LCPIEIVAGPHHAQLRQLGDVHRNRSRLIFTERSDGALRDSASRNDALRNGVLRADAMGCEHLGTAGLTRIKADTMTLRDYKSRKSTRFAAGRLLLLRLPYLRRVSAMLSSS